MPYTVTRQLQWPEGRKVVEVSARGLDYTNPDALSPKYPGEFETYDDPREEVEAAITIWEAWREEGAPEAQVGVGATLGMTMPFEPRTYEEARAWADKAAEKLPQCNYCGDPLPARPYRHRELDDQQFCSEYCAEETYGDVLDIEPVAFEVCDSCLTVACDQGVREKAREARLMATIGADLEDHLYNAVEEPGTRRERGCQTRRKSRETGTPTPHIG